MSVTKSWWPSVAVAGAVVLLAGACSSGEGAEPVTSVESAASVTTSALTSTTATTATTSTTVPETTTTTIDLVDEEDLVFSVDDPRSVEAELETAWYRSVAAYHQATGDPSVEPPELELTQAGPNLEETRLKITNLQETGRFVVAGDLQQNIVQGITVVDETHGVVDACVLDDGEFYYLEDPETKAAGGLFTITFSAQIELIDGRWKVTDNNQVDVVGGVGGCASFEVSS